jgi:hypothetical protein
MIRENPVEKHVTLMQVETNELLAIEGGQGRAVATTGNTYTLWRDIKNNGGWVDPTPPITPPSGPLDFHQILTSGSPE